MKEYRIQPVRALVHGLKDPYAPDILEAPEGIELYRREGIRLVSLGIYPDEDAAKAAAKKHAAGERIKFV
jgi:hypothetical protein